MRTQKIAESLKLHCSTVRLTLQNAKKIEEKAKKIEENAKKIKGKAKSVPTCVMEIVLFEWIIDQQEKGVFLNGIMIKDKAKSLFESIKDEKNCSEEFIDWDEWYQGFKERYHRQTVGESECQDFDSSSLDFVSTFENMINVCNYYPHQVYNVAEVKLLWKKMPNCLRTKGRKVTSSGSEVQKNRLTLLLGGNASGDAKLKPLIVFRSFDSTSQKFNNNKNLSVILHNNKTAFITSVKFVMWFRDYFIPFVEKYNREKNLTNKALLVLDNLPGCTMNLNEFHPSIKVVVLPPKTKATLQPMDQGVSTLFKAYYQGECTRKFEKATCGNENKMVSYWKGFTMNSAIDIIDTAWKMVPQSMLNGGWKRLWPKCVHAQQIDEKPESVNNDGTMTHVCVGSSMNDTLAECSQTDENQVSKIELQQIESCSSLMNHIESDAPAVCDDTTNDNLQGHIESDAPAMCDDTANDCSQGHIESDAPAMCDDTTNDNLQGHIESDAPAMCDDTTNDNLQGHIESDAPAMCDDTTNLQGHIKSDAPAMCDNTTNDNLQGHIESDALAMCDDTTNEFSSSNQEKFSVPLDLAEQLKKMINKIERNPDARRAFCSTLDGLVKSYLRR
ncbi:HTH CenpB-type DNA-binding domain [Trinorchestia longiramus]|nr:HTH CenpB-type DNA-binding domain [Trinorchestia longiramus]